MKLLRHTLIFSVLIGTSITALAQTPRQAASCNLADVQSVLSQAVDGEIIAIPSGTCEWTTGLRVSGKGVHLQGAGAGRVIARSESSVSVGTGTKVFTIQSGLNITVGQTLRIDRTGGVVSNNLPTGALAGMTGTVVSYSDSQLTMNITNVEGTGTHPLWIISTMPATTLVHSAGSSVLLTLEEDASHNVELSGIRFVTGTGTNDYIHFDGNNGKPLLVHDCYFLSSKNFDVIETGLNRGIIWNSSFVALPYSRAQLAIHHVHASTDSWTTPSTMGTADPTGTSNLYIEDSDFRGWLNATDFDNNARSVIRYNLFNHAGLGTHGADSSQYGQRHFEFYNNYYTFKGFSGPQTLPYARIFYIRGGTGVIADNEIYPPVGNDYPTAPGLDMTIMNLQRSVGPNPCWGAGIPGIQYPSPRQVGMGRVTGTAGFDSVTYRGDSEPLYVWGNTGGTLRVGKSDFGECSDTDKTSDYVVEGRDYFINVPKPGYTKYPYPHPLRTGIRNPTPPLRLRVE